MIRRMLYCIKMKHTRRSLIHSHYNNQEASIHVKFVMFISSIMRRLSVKVYGTFADTGSEPPSVGE